MTSFKSSIFLLESTQKLKAFVLALAVLVPTLSLAQTDPFDPSSPNYVGNKSKSNKAKVKVKKWNLTTSATVFRGFDELAEPGAYYDATFGYGFGKGLSGAVTAAYSHPLDLDASNPDRWEFENVNLRVVKSGFWKSASRAQQLALIGGVSLPTSKASQNAGTLFSSSWTARYTYRWKRFTWAVSPTAVLAWHRYETADKSGFLRNSPLGLSLAGSVRYGVTRKLGLVLSGSFYNAFDYEMDVRHIQTVRGSVQYSPTRRSFVSLGARWRDRVLTNNPVFDDDASAWTLTYGYTL